MTFKVKLYYSSNSFLLRKYIIMPLRYIIFLEARINYSTPNLAPSSCFACLYYYAGIESDVIRNERKMQHV